MPTLFKTVRKNGSGDYTDLVPAISGILASGVIATGYYDSYVLSVDSGIYSGYFQAVVPYSGTLNIIGSGTWFIAQGTSTISGEIPFGGTTLELSEFTINCGDCSTEVFNIYSGSAFNIYNTEFLQVTHGLINSGTLVLNNISAQGVGPLSGGCFLKDYGQSIISDSRIAYFVSGIYSNDLNLVNSFSTDNISHVIGYSGIISIANSVINGGSSGVIFECTPTGDLFINTTTINTDYPIVVSGVRLYLTDSILYGNDYSIRGSVESGLLTDSCLFPSGTLINITQTNIKNVNPQFNDSVHGDFRLKFKQTTGSPCIEFKDQGNLSNGVNMYTEQAQFDIRDSRGIPATETFYNFLYKQGNTLLISDYLKELQFSNIASNYSNLTYKVEMLANFDASGVQTTSAFSRVASRFPYDWDYKVFNTTEITNRHKYIIPRTIVDVVDTISGFLGQLTQSVVFNKLDKRFITPYLFSDFRGVAFDQDLSVPGTAFVWMLEGNNQTLIQMNAYTNERLGEYPLFVPNISGQLTIKPSGVIKIGVEKDQFKYILESDPNVELLCDNQDGLFKWISTDLDTHKDARGLVAYKGNLYLTLTEYNPQSIYDRTTIPVYSGAVGKLLIYNNNDTFEHYIANYTNQVGPSSFKLGSGNCYPTDLTIYEDGTMMVADWTNSSGLFRYKFAYDYALVQSNYDTETRILLREYYDNVEL